MNNTLSQTAQFFYFVYAGMLIGMQYDILDMFRTGSRFLDAALDTVFWAGALITAGVTLMYVNNMTFRGLAAVGFIAGFAAYHFTLGAVLRFLFNKAVDFLRMLVSALLVLLQ